MNGGILWIQILNERRHMRGKTHTLVGVSAMLLLTAKYGTQVDIMGVTVSTPIALLTASTGSLLPDIDLHTTKLGSKHKFIAKHLKHRGITHTLLMPGIFLFAMMASANYITNNILRIFFNSLLFGLLFGWTMHIVADLFNRKGVPLFWPITKKKIHIATVTTGTWQESAWLLCYLVIAVGLICLKGNLL